MPFLQEIGPDRPTRGWRGAAPRLPILASIALMFTLPVIAEPADSHAPLGDRPTGARGLRPSTTLPGPSGPLSWTVSLPTFTSSSELTATHPFPGLAPGSRSAAIGPRLADGLDAGGFAGRLLSRMKREAQRYRRENVSTAPTAAYWTPFDEIDSIAADQRSQEAERIVTRSARRTIDLELERLARQSLGLGATLDFFGRLSTQGGRPDATNPGGGAGSSIASETARQDRLTGSIGVRLDAHPALVLRATFRGIRGRIDLPALDEPARLSIDGPFGPHGRAVLTSGMPRGGDGWTTLTLNFRF